MGRVELSTPLPCTEKGMQSEAWVSRKAISQSSRLSFHSGNKICGMTVCTMDLQDPMLRCFLLLVVRTEGALASPWWPSRWSPDPKTPALQAGNSLCWIETQSIRPCFTSLTSSSPLVIIQWGAAGCKRMLQIGFYMLRTQEAWVRKWSSKMWLFLCTVNTLSSAS